MYRLRVKQYNCADFGLETFNALYGVLNIP